MLRNLKKITWATAITLLLGYQPLAQADISQDPNVKQFIDNMVQKNHFDKTHLTKIFEQVNYQPSVVAAISRPYEAKPWYQYKSLFVTPQKTSDGVLFWQQNAKDLARAEKEYGVPASIIVAIIGVETQYGKKTGDYLVVEALSTLAFQYPPRSEFFTKELEQFLLLTKNDKLDPMTIKGSYAGAMGQPQFMPSSYRAYAIDYSGNGYPNLLDNTSDVIGSVANYLHKNGWVANAPIAVPAQLTSDNYKKLSTKRQKPSLDLTQLAQYGVKPECEYSTQDKASLVALEHDQDQEEYWLGFDNFYVITRYNTSQLYAMAVYQLSQSIERQYQVAQKETGAKVS